MKRIIKYIPHIILTIWILLLVVTVGFYFYFKNHDYSKKPSNPPVTAQNTPASNTDSSKKDEQVPSPAIGDKAPDFTLRDINGNLVRLEDYKNKVVFLNFWASWCEYCQDEFNMFKNEYPKYKGKNIEIVTVNVMENIDVVKAFKQKFGLEFPILLDEKGEVTKKYYITSIPTTYIIDGNGIIRDIHTGLMTPEDFKKYVEEVGE